MEKMGGVIGRFTRPLKNFNVENRAMKVISMEKPKPAPRHPTTLKYMEELKKGAQAPTKEEEDIHLNRLKQVYVKSTDTVTGRPDASESSDRQLPLDRKIHEDPEFGFIEPVTISPGRVTLRQAVDLVNKHGNEPEQWTVDAIAKEYKLDVRLVEAIVSHFQPFLLRFPEKTKLDKDWKKSWAKQLSLPERPKLIDD